MDRTWRYWTTEQKGKWQLFVDTPQGRRDAVSQGAMFFTWAALSEPYVGDNGHPEPIRFGDLHIDFDDKAKPENALKDIRTLGLVHLPELLDVDPYGLQFYASGEKGFHLTIPAKFFNAQDGDPYLHLVFKRIVAEWAEKFKLETVDHSLYPGKKGKMFRLPNVKRANGNYKVPLTLEELQGCSMEEIQELQKKKRKIEPVDFDLVENIELEALFRNTRAQVYAELEDRPKPRLSKKQKEILSKDLPPCINYILSAHPQTGRTNFNILCVNLINYYHMAGYSKEDAWETAQDFVENYPYSQTYQTREKRTEHWNTIWHYLLGNDAYGFDCGYIKGLGFPGTAFECSHCLSEKKNPIDSKKILEGLGRNEDGDALLFMELFRDRFCFDHSTGTWFEFKGHFWEEDGLDQATASVDDVINLYVGEAKQYGDKRVDAETNDEKDKAKKFAATQDALIKRVKALQTAQRKRNILIGARAGRGSLGITGNEWDAHTMVLPCLNGVIDLATGRFREGTPKDYYKTVAPVQYQGMDARAVIWEKSLDQIFSQHKEISEFLQRLFGYALTGKSNEARHPIFWGKGRNGKGTITEAIAYVLGPMAGPVEAEMILAQRYGKKSGGPTSDIMALRGKRLVWASETDQGRSLNVGKLKWLTGADTLTGRPPYGKRQVTFRPSHTLILLTNHKPRINTTDFALWSRVLLVPFLNAFVDVPVAPNEYRKDPGLFEKLKTEAPGILGWLVRGCLEYQKSGLNPPDAVLAATKEYKEDEDLLGQFIKERCVLDEKAEVKSGELYKAYKAWAEEIGNRPISMTAFGSEMKNRFDSYQKKNVFYIGVRLG